MTRDIQQTAAIPVADPLPEHTLTPARAAWLVTLVMLVWASSSVVVRAVYQEIPPVGLSFWRWLVAGLVLTPFVVRRIWRDRARLCRGAGRFLLLGIFMVGGGTVLFYALQFTTATNASLVNATQPALTGIAVWLLLGERPSVRQLFGIGIATGGVLITVAQGNPMVLLYLSFNPGDLLVLGSVAVYALYAVYLPRWAHGFDPLTVIFLVCLAGVAALLPWYLAETLGGKPVPVTRATLLAVGYLAAFPSVLAVYLWNRSIAVLGANRTAIFANLLPIFGALLAVVFLRERLYLYHGLSLLLILVGISLVVRGAGEVVRRAR
ncbi:MAG: DMT family transporter [Gammaproteobacteria bacterium]|nr:DMT family transporter [Gammaproteobacteria bacterium]